MRGPSWDVGGYEAVVELVVLMPEGRLVEAAERRIGQCVERRFDRVVWVTEAQARVWVQVRGWLRVGPEEALPGSVDGCAANYFVRPGVR